MKQIITLITIAFLTLVCYQQQALAQKTQGPGVGSKPKENVEQILTKMERDWADAILKKDFVTIDRIVAEDCIFTVPDGRTLTRTQVNEELRAGVWVPESLAYENMKVRVFGDAAVVTAVQIEKSKSNGKDSSGSYLFTDVFVKRDGRWQLVAEHGSRLEQVKP